MPSARRVIQERGKGDGSQDSHGEKGEKGLEWKDIQEKEKSK